MLQKKKKEKKNISSRVSRTVNHYGKNKTKKLRHNPRKVKAVKDLKSF